MGVEGAQFEHHGITKTAGPFIDDRVGIGMSRWGRDGPAGQ